MLYVSADEHIAREVVDVFEAQTGIDVLMVGDSEAKKTTGLVQRLRREADHPQADVFWSSEVFMTIRLAEEGVLAEHLSDATVDWPAAHRDGGRRWYGFAARARVIVYATDRVPADRVPRSWMDLTDPTFRGRIVMADPRFGTTGGHLAAMKAFWRRAMLGEAYYEAFLMGLADNEVRLLPSGNAGVVRAVAEGEADVGLTDTDDVWAARARDLGVALVFPLHDVRERRRGRGGRGTLLIPNTVGRVAGGPNPEAAATLIDFLLSERVERLLAESASRNVPLRPGLGAAYPELAVDDPLEVDFADAAAQYDAAVRRAMEILAAKD